MLDWNPEIKLSDLLTIGSVAVAAAALLGAWVKDRRLRKREYADKVRQASARALGALERWKEVSLSLFDQIQPLLTDADAMLVKEQDVVTTRDFLWRALVDASGGDADGCRISFGPPPARVRAFTLRQAYRWSVGAQGEG
jgi:hypothetical protein